VAIGFGCDSTGSEAAANTSPLQRREEEHRRAESVTEKRERRKKRGDTPLLQHGQERFLLCVCAILCLRKAQDWQREGRGGREGRLMLVCCAELSEQEVNQLELRPSGGQSCGESDESTSLFLFLSLSLLLTLSPCALCGLSEGRG
jgi:hypothetical protein